MPQNFHESLLEATSSALDDVRNRYYENARLDVFSAISQVLDAERLELIENLARSKARQGKPLYQGGIHYRPDDDKWLPLGFINVTQLNKNPLWDQFNAFVNACGHDKHFSLGKFCKRAVPAKIEMKIERQQIDLFRSIDVSCGGDGYNYPGDIRSRLQNYDAEVLDFLVGEQLKMRVSDEGLGGLWVESAKAKDHWLEWVSKEPALKLFTSLYFMIRENPFPEAAQKAIFLNWPSIGGYAFVGKPSRGSHLWENIHTVFERILVTIALLHGKLTSEGRDLSPDQQVDQAVCQAIREALEGYLPNLQKPKNALNAFLHLDKCQPFRYVHRIGHKSEVTPENRKKLLLTRLAAKSASAVNFLYADNGTMLNRIQGFLDGILTQLRPTGAIQAEEAILDVYVAPIVSDVNTRRLTLYKHEQIPVQPKSIYAKWYQKIFKPGNDDAIEIPCVIYRYSETVGPSILVSEVAAVIAKHLVAMHPEGTPLPAKLPLRVLNLFSGTGSGELTLWDTFSEPGKDPSSLVSVLSLDLNPISLLSEGSSQEERNVVKRAMRVSHSIPTDIFALLSNDPRGAENVYLREYDITMADPPHYLVMDFLFQRAPKTGEYLFKQLANNTSGVFILYFGHEEVEWMNVYIHWHLQNMGWPVIWNLLLGEERLILCFGKNACVSRQGCRNDLLAGLRAVATYYYGDEGRMEVRDTFMRKLDEQG